MRDSTFKGSGIQAEHDPICFFLAGSEKKCLTPWFVRNEMLGKYVNLVKSTYPLKESRSSMGTSTTSQNSPTSDLISGLVDQCGSV